MFSSKACWLLSALTSGAITNGTCSTSTRLSVGTLAPIMRMRTGGVPGDVDSRALAAQAPSGESSGVRSAWLPPLSVSDASLS